MAIIRFSGCFPNLSPIRAERSTSSFRSTSRPNLIRGYGFGRPGRGAAQIGPLVAVNPGAAGELMDRLRRDLGQSAIIADVAAGNRKARDLLERHGFSPARHLVRMFRGPNAFPGQLEAEEVPRSRFHVPRFTSRYGPGASVTNSGVNVERGTWNVKRESAGGDSCSL